MGLKMEFVRRAGKPDANLSALCREYGITRQTGHKWVRRYAEEGVDGLQELRPLAVLHVVRAYARDVLDALTQASSDAWHHVTSLVSAAIITLARERKPSRSRPRIALNMGAAGG